MSPPERTAAGNTMVPTGTTTFTRTFISCARDSKTSSERIANYKTLAIIGTTTKTRYHVFGYILR